MKTINTLTVAALTTIALASATGCAHSGLGQPPLATDLRNDGSAAAQRASLDQYRVEYQDGWIARPAAGGDFGECAMSRSRASSRDAFTYLTSSEEAEEALDTPAVGFARVAGSDTLNKVLFVGGTALGAGIGAAAVVPMTADHFNGDRRSAASDMGALNLAGWTIVGSAALGALSAIPVVILKDAIVVPMAEEAAEDDYRLAVSEFNNDLEQRVQTASTDKNARQVASR